MKKKVFLLIVNWFLLIKLFSISFSQDTTITLPNLDRLVETSVNSGTVKEFMDTIPNYISETGQAALDGLIHYYTGEKYYYLSEWENAEKSYLNSIEVLESIDSIKVSAAHNNLGLVYLYLALYDKALESFHSSLVIDLALKDEMGVGQCYQNIALVMELNSQFKSAISMYHNALEVFNNLDLKEEVATIYNNLGACYAKLDNLSQAQKMYMRALEFFQKINNDEMEAIVLYNVGNLLIRDKKYTQASHFIERALVFFKNNNDKASEISAYGSLGNISLAKKDYNQALFLFELAKDKAISINYREKVLQNYYLLYMTHKESGNIVKSLENLEKYSLLSDSLREGNSNYDFGLLDREVEEILTSESELKFYLLGKDRVKTYLLILLFIVTITLSYIYISTKTKYKKCKKSFALQNKLLDNRINPDFTLTLIKSLSGNENIIHRELISNLVYKIINVSQKPIITLSEEIEFIKMYSKVFEIINNKKINLHIDYAEAGNCDKIDLPSMISVYYLNTILSKNKVNFPNIEVKVAFVREGEFLQLFFEDNSSKLTESQIEEMTNFYISVFEYICKEMDKPVLCKLINKDIDSFISFSESKTINSKEGNFVKLTIPIS